jgi:uncharacterized protein YqjF (DUF2071 family)
MAFPFLRSRWINLLLANYPVAPGLVEKYLLPGLELDLLDGQAFASLVALEMKDVRVLGIGWPGLRHFAELNLRFYVRRRGERGVRFVRQVIPSRLLAWVGRTFFDEPFSAAPITAAVHDKADGVTVEYRLPWGGRACTLTVSGGKPVRTKETAEELWFTDREFAYDVTRQGQLTHYRVAHPEWAVYPVQGAHLDLDWGQLYGPEWAVLNGVRPASTVFAAGSPVTVYSAVKVR